MFGLTAPVSEKIPNLAHVPRDSVKLQVITPLSEISSKQHHSFTSCYPSFSPCTSISVSLISRSNLVRAEKIPYWAKDAIWSRQLGRRPSV